MLNIAPNYARLKRMLLLHRHVLRDVYTQRTTHSINTQSDNSVRYEDIVFQLHVTFLFALSASPPPPILALSLSFPFALAC